MSTETVQQMEQRWAIAMAAKDQQGRRKHDIDLTYQRDCMALRVQIEEAKSAEASRPQINADQLRWLDRMRGLNSSDGKPLLFDLSERGTKFRANLDNLQARVARGEDISAVIAKSEQDLTAQKLALPAPAIDQSAVIKARATNHVGVHLPPAGATNLGAGAIITEHLK